MRFLQPFKHFKEPQDVIAILNVVFTEFDNQIEGTGAYKVETVGEVYMAVAGAPDRCNDHATRAATFALKIMQSLETIKEKSMRSTAVILQIKLTSTSG